MKKNLIYIVYFFSLILPFYLIFPFNSHAYNTITLTFSNFFPSAHKNSKIMEEWIKEIEKRTGGKVKIKYYPGGTLTPATQIYDGVVKGISDIGESCFAYTRGKFPAMEFVDLPLGYTSAIQATRFVNHYYKRFKPRELDDVKVLFLHAHGPGILYTTFPVDRLEDLRGRKIRATGLASKVVTALGAAPVGTAMYETYDALRTGVVEGAMAPAEALQGWKWGEVVSYTVQNFGSAYTTAMFVVMNKQKWDSLPGDIQRIFEQVSEEWIEKQGRLWDEIDREGIAFARSRGKKIISLSAEENSRWALAVKPLIDEYIRNTHAKGLPGEDAARFAMNYLKSPSMLASTDIREDAPVKAAAPVRIASPDLSIVSVTLREPSGNNVLDAGEKGSIIVKVKNSGKGEATGVALNIDSVDAKGNQRFIEGLRFNNKNYIGTIRPGEEKTYSIGITASDDIETSDIILKTTLVEENGFDSQPLYIAFKSKELAPPLLQITRVEVQDVDGKRVITMGKEVTVTLTLQNSGSGSARGVYAEMVNQSNEIAVLGDKNVSVGVINPGESKKIQFSINVTRRYKGPNVLPISFQIKEERERYSIVPKIRLAINEEAPSMKIVKVEAIETPPVPVRKIAEDINEPPRLTHSQKAFGQNDHAVIIGIEQYLNKLPKSEFSYNDAELVKKYLEAIGFSPRNIEILKDEKATKTGIQKIIERWLPNRVKKDSRVFVYYSGHGAPDPATGDAYIVPYDGDPEYLKDTGYSLKTLYERLGKLDVKEIIVALDACFSGAGGRSVLARGARPLVMTTERIVLPKNMAVITATQGSQISTSSPEREHGIFTYHFLKAIKEGKKSLSEIYEYIKPIVEDDAKRLNANQTPSITPESDKLRGIFILRK